MTESDANTLLTIPQAHEALQSLGIRCSRRQVMRWAHTRMLPFFKFGKVLMISRNELVTHFRRLQADAVSQIQKGRPLR